MNSNNPDRKNAGDPLLFVGDDDNDDFDALLGADHDTFGNLDFDPLDPNSDLGSWLQNTSMSNLSPVVDTGHDDDTSLSESNLLSVNPDSIMPLEPVQPPQQQLEDIETINGAAMRLHANCSDMEELKAVNVIVQQPPDPQQQTQHIQIVAIPVTASTGNSTPIHSPMKTNTIILDSNTGTFSVAGTTYIASPQKLQTVSSGQQTLQRDLTPSQCSPVLVGHLQSRVAATNRPITVTMASALQHTNIVSHSEQLSKPQQTITSVQRHSMKQEDKAYPKPVYSYSCLIALALKNSKTGNLPVNEIYNFMCENFPYFKTAPDGWKNSVRHNLSLNKCFAKVDNPKLSSGAKKGCLWALNPAKVKKMDDEITKWRKKDPTNLLSSMAYPENLEAIENGQAGLPFHKDFDSDEDENEPQLSPSTLIKQELMSTPQKPVEGLMIANFPASPMKEDLEQEYAAHALQWSMQTTDLLSLHTDFVSSPVPSSPASVHGSPLPHTPSRSASKLGMSPMYHNGYVNSSPARMFAHGSPSAVRSNLFGVTPPRTLSALN